MKYIDYSEKDGKGYLYFNRPAKKNAFDRALLVELELLLGELAGKNIPKLLFISGKGDAFSAGVDLKALLDLQSVEEVRAFALLLETVSEKIYRFPVPVIAVVNGWAFGGGFGFATAADIRIISEEARIGYPAVKLGAILPATCTVYLQSLIGRGKVMDLLMTGKILTGREAYETGLAEYVFPRENLWEEAEQIADTILEGGNLALQMTKHTVNYLTNLQLEAMKLYAADNFAFLSQTETWRGRMQAFASKSKK